MNNEWLMILTMAVSGTLFAAGGTDLNGKGYKWLRRYVLPAFLCIMALICHVSWWQSAILLTLAVPLSMGYGSGTPYWRKAIVFSLYGAPTLAIGFSWWIIITPILLFLLFCASNWKPLASTVFWKSWEFLAGVLISLCFIASLLNRW